MAHDLSLTQLVQLVTSSHIHQSGASCCSIKTTKWFTTTISVMKEQTLSHIASIHSCRFNSSMEHSVSQVVGHVNVRVMLWVTWSLSSKMFLPRRIRSDWHLHTMVTQVRFRLKSIKKELKQWFVTLTSHMKMEHFRSMTQLFKRQSVNSKVSWKRSNKFTLVMRILWLSVVQMNCLNRSTQSSCIRVWDSQSWTSCGVRLVTHRRRLLASSIHQSSWLLGLEQDSKWLRSVNRFCWFNSFVIMSRSGVSGKSLIDIISMTSKTLISSRTIFERWFRGVRFKSGQQHSMMRFTLWITTSSLLTTMLLFQSSIICWIRQSSFTTTSRRLNSKT